MSDSQHIVRRWRRTQKPPIPQRALAGKVGITKASLSRVESGKMPLSVDLAMKLCVATGIPMRELCPELAEMFDTNRPAQPAGAAP